MNDKQLIVFVSLALVINIFYATVLNSIGLDNLGVLLALSLATGVFCGEFVRRKVK